LPVIKSLEALSDQFESPINSLNDKSIDIMLYPKELMNEWPSLLDPNISQDSNSEKQKPALTPEEFEYCIQEMKEFANYVIRIALYHLHVNQHDPQAKDKYDKLFVNTNQ